jgi:tungstate transport system ATP-binding protein
MLLPVKYLKKKINFQKNLVKYMKFFNLELLLDKNTRKLSGGEKTKTALLRAFIRNTDLVILDEPASNMDVEA